MQELISKLIPLCVELDKIGRQTKYFSRQDAVDNGYEDGAHEAYTAIENLIGAYANTSEQAKELESLREFANDVCKNYMWSIGVDASFKLFNQHGLLDGNGNPTKLLTGE
jgi:hypothetical protein